MKLSEICLKQIKQLLVCNLGHKTYHMYTSSRIRMFKYVTYDTAFSERIYVLEFQ